MNTRAFVSTEEYRYDVVERLARIETTLLAIASQEVRLRSLEMWRNGLTVALGALALLVGAKLGLPLASIAALAHP